VSRLGSHPARQSPRDGVLVSCPFFTTEKLLLDGTVSGNARMIVVLDGNLEIDGQTAKAGEVWYADCATDPMKLTGQATVLLTS